MSQLYLSVRYTRVLGKYITPNAIDSSSQAAFAPPSSIYCCSLACVGSLSNANGSCGKAHLIGAFVSGDCILVSKLAEQSSSVSAGSLVGHSS